MLQHPSVRPWERSVVWAIASAIHDVWSGTWDDNAAAVVERYASFVQRVQSLNIDVDAAPILDVNREKSPLIAGKCHSKAIADQTVSYTLTYTNCCKHLAVG